jgi:pimeloyl-ACP methyl ester carboxylesterase
VHQCGRCIGHIQPERVRTAAPSNAAGRSGSTTTATAISADGTVIGYESVGAGPPLLVVHGSTGTRARWSPVLGSLAQRYTVHAIKTMSDPREILDAFYRETLHLPDSAIKDLADREFPYLAESIAHNAVRELAEVGAYHATERLANMSVPVRMLLGAESPAYFRAATAAVAAQIPGATIVAMKGQGHQPIDYDHNSPSGR